MPKSKTNSKNIYCYAGDVGDYLEVLPKDVISGEWIETPITNKKHDGTLNRLAVLIITRKFQKKHKLRLDMVWVTEEVSVGGTDDSYDNSKALNSLITPNPSLSHREPTQILVSCSDLQY